MDLCTIKRSSEFQRVRGGSRAANPSFVIETRPRSGDGMSDGHACRGPRVGFTITRKIGNAVVRNRIRRRFREVLRGLEPGVLRAGHDYVMVARPGVIEQPFAELRTLIESAVNRVHQPESARSGTGRKTSQSERAKPRQR